MLKNFRQLLPDILRLLPAHASRRLRVSAAQTTFRQKIKKAEKGTIHQCRVFLEKVDR